jgi:hypothetical protein
MQKQLVIDEQTAKKVYSTASAEFKAMLEDSFGKPFFSQKITDRVKSFEDACEVLDLDPENIIDEVVDTKDEIAYKKLKVIAQALNEGWKPNWNNSNERKWWPWFYMNEPGFRFGVCGFNFGDSGVGARLVFKTEELAKYAAEQFTDLYNDYFTL